MASLFSGYGNANVQFTAVLQTDCHLLTRDPSPAADDDSEAYTEAELIAFCAEWRVATDEYIPLTIRLDRILEKDQPRAERDRLKVVEADIGELEQIIFDTPARTMAGVQAKAGVMAYMIEAMDLAPTGEQSASLITDVLALGSAA